MDEKNKPSANPSDSDVKSEEGEDVASQKLETTTGIEEQKDPSVEKEVEEALAKLEEKKEEKSSEKSSDESSEKEELDKLSLEEINTLTKRDFKSKEDFFKHYENLASFSGSDKAQDLRKKADNYDQMIKDAGEIEKLLAQKDEAKVEKQTSGVKKKDQKFVDLEAKISTTDEKIDTTAVEVGRLKEQLADAEFIEQYSEAKPYLNIIKAIANKEDKTLDEVYKGSDLETLISDSKALQEAKKDEKNLGVSSKNRLAPTMMQKRTDLIRRIKESEKGETKARDISDLKQALVEEVLKIDSQ